MRTTYEVWYLTEDGITSQVTDEDGLAKEYATVAAAKASAQDVKAKGAGEWKVAKAWVLEKKAVYEC